MKQLNYYQDMTRATDTKPTDALSVADELLVPIEGFPEPTRLEVMAAESLRAQHRLIEILECALRDADTELEAAKRDAARYRWLRHQHWNMADMCVVENPKKNVLLGARCPSRELLDAAIDAAAGAAQKEQQE